MKSIIGNWGELFETTIMGIHQLVLEDGRVLYWGSSDKAEAFSNTQDYGIYDPKTQTHEILNSEHSVGMFCGAGITLPGTDKILIAAGNGGGLSAGRIFDLSDQTWESNDSTKLDKDRFYPTLTSLSSGQAIILGGSGTDGVPELFTLGEGWRKLEGAQNDDVKDKHWYPRSWVNKNGELIYFAIKAGDQEAGAADFGSMEVMALDPSGNGSLRQIGDLPMQMDVTSPSVMFDLGKIAMMDANGDLWIMDINGDEPRFTFAADLPSDRNSSDMTVLPDGRILINGGSTIGNSQSEDNAVFASAIFDPYTGTVNTVDAEAVMRLYHSSSVLLPDGTILSMGGGGLEDTKHFLDAQIYSPDYLFNEDGTLADRPEIFSAPNSLIPGDSFVITVDDASAIARLSFVKTGSVTHSVNMEHGRFDLEFSQISETELSVTLPDNPNVLSAGNWMIFAIDDQGVPSQAPIISIEPTLPLFEPVTDEAAPVLEGFINVEYFDAPRDVEVLEDIDFDAAPLASETLNSIQEESQNSSFFSGVPNDYFAAQYQGLFSIEQAGNYTFFLNSDNGANLFIDGEKIIDNDGPDGAREISATIRLKAGTHSLNAQYFDRQNDATMELDWSGPNFGKSTFEVNGIVPSEPVATTPDFLEQMLTNGDFRNGDLDGWQVLNPTGSTAPKVKDNALVLNSDGEDNYGDGVEQIIQTEIGAIYEVSMVARENGNHSDQHTARLQALDTNGDVIAEQEVNVSRGQIRTLSFEFTASETIVKLVATNPNSNDSQDTDLFIDNISMMKIPEAGAGIGGGNQNTAPVANDDVVDVILASDEVVGDNVDFLLANDFDINGDSFKITSATSALGADVILEDRDGDGSFDWIGYDPLQSDTLKSLPKGQQITDTVTYTISDGKGGTDSANITLTVEGSAQNQGPIANDDVVDVQLRADEVVGDSVAFLLENDSDPNGDQISVTSVTATSARGAAVSLIDTNGDGKMDYIQYDPTASDTLAELPIGQQIDDTVTYFVSNSVGGTASATIDLTIIGTPSIAMDNTPLETPLMMDEAVV